MATGGFDPSACDSRVVCSVCLEPYRGRQPKLLPCHHTFCLPCLHQLYDRAARQQEAPTELLKLTIVCPTCRKVASVPEGGVASFQSNFYVDDDSDGSQLAGGMVNAVQDDAAEKSMRKARDQMQVLEAAVGKLAEKEKEVDNQKRALDQELNIRYAMLLGLVADARDDFLRSARDTAAAKKEQVQEEIAAAKTILTKLSAVVGSPTMNRTQMQAALLTDADVAKFQQVSQESLASFFTCSFNDDTTQLAAALKGFFGSVRPAGEQLLQPQEDTNGVKSHSGASPALSSDHFENASDQNDKWKSRFEELCIRVEALLNENKMVQDRNAAIARDFVSMQKDFSTMQKDLAAVSREAACHRDKNAILCQDVAMLQTENVRLRQDLAKVQTESSDCAKSIAAVQRVGTSSSAAYARSDQVAAVEKKVAALERTVERSSSDITTLEEKINNASKQVFFQATLSATVRTRSVRKLMYKKVLENEGSAYDSDTGIFTAPVSGTYMFTVIATPADDDKPAELDIKNGDYYSSEMLAYIHCNESETSSTGHAVVHLSEGEQVWVETYEESSSFQSGHLNTFSGMLVQPDYD